MLGRKRESGEVSLTARFTEIQRALETDGHRFSRTIVGEGSAHIPLVMAGPGIAQGQISNRPVSLVDLYPTLLELAGLAARPDVDSVSIAPLLRNPSARWDRPALTRSGFRNHALRSERWRYILYADGSEELYDHDADPLERVNVASKPELESINTDLQRWLPKKDEPLHPNSEGGKKSDDRHSGGNRRI